MNEPFKLGLMKKVSSLRTKEDFSAFVVYNLLNAGKSFKTLLKV